MNLVRAGVGALFLANAALGFVMLAASSSCAPTAAAPAAHASPSTSSAPIAASASAPSAPSGSKPAVEAIPSSATFIVNVRATKDGPLGWVLGSDVFRIAHLVARLNLDKDVDWLAFAHTPSRTEQDVLLVHHHIDPNEMAEVLDLEGSRESGSPGAPHVWQPRGAPRGFLIVELDPSTLAFGFRRALARTDDVARLRSMGELSGASVNATFLHRPVAVVDASAPRNVTLKLELVRGEGSKIEVALTSDIEDTAPLDDLAVALGETLAEHGYAFGKTKRGTILDRLQPTRVDHTWGLRGTITSYDVSDALRELTR